MLLAPSLRLLEPLRLNPRKSFAGRVRGERLTRRKGISIDFADYRDYAEGDDLRHLDWNVLARLDTPVMRTYQDEEDLALHLLLDVSPSMDFGEPSKLEAARSLAAALSYVALAGGDAVRPLTVGARSASPRPMRGRSSFLRLSEWLKQAKPQESSQEALSQSLNRFAKSSARPGIALIVTDALDPDAAASIRLLGSRGHEVWLLQVLSTIELDPDLEGDLRLVDGEGGPIREITANSAVLTEYRRNLNDHLDGLRDAVKRVGGRFALIDTSVPLQTAIRDTFKREGWVT